MNLLKSVFAALVMLGACELFGFPSSEPGPPPAEPKPFRLSRADAARWV